MQKNVGTIDAVIRITFGLLGLAYGAGKMSRRPYKTPGLLMFLSAMKVAEGVTGFCPALKLLGASTRREDMMRMIVDKTLRSVTKGASGSSDGGKTTAEPQHMANGEGQRQQHTAASTAAHGTQQQATAKTGVQSTGTQSQSTGSSTSKKEMSDEMMMNMAEEITNAVVHSHSQTTGSVT